MVQAVCEHHEWIEVTYSDSVGNNSTTMQCRKCGHLFTDLPLSSASEQGDMIEKAKSLFMVFQKILTDYGLVEWGQLKCAKEITIACTNEIMEALDNLPHTQYTKEIDEEANRWADIQQHIQKI